MSQEILQKIKDQLEELSISYKHIHHERIESNCVSASQIRGTPLEKGAKALLLETKSGNHIQAVIPAHLRLDVKKVKRLVGEKNVSLISPDKVLALTDCVIGSVPPFGSLWNIPVFVDKALLENEEVVFSAGTLEDSILIAPKDLVRCNAATVVSLYKEI